MSGELVERMRRHLESTIDEAVERATGERGRPAGTVRARQPAGSAPGSAVPDSGGGRLNDPATGNPWFILGVDSFDDGTKYF